MADPITVNRMFGFVTSTIPDAFKYPYPSPLFDHTGGIVDLWSTIEFRQASPSANKTSVITATAQSYGNTNQQIGTGSLSIAYDVNANTTTIKIQNSTDTAQMVVPINLQQVYSDQDPKVSAGILVVNPKAGTSQTNVFSGSSGGNAYQGKLVSYSGGANGDSFTAYQFQDADGKTILYAQANIGGKPNIRIPGATGFGTAAYAYGPTPSGSVLPPNCGSGTFSQTKNGQTLTGTFQPLSFSVTSFDASQDAYWSTH